VFLKKLFPLFISFLLLVFPGILFAAEAECTESSVSCRCTNSEGKQITTKSPSAGGDMLCHNYCYDTKATSYEFFCGTSSTPTTSGEVSSLLTEILSLDTKKEENPTVPALNVPIPGLDLSNSIQVDSKGNIETNMIGLYVNAVFSYGITLAAIFGVLMFTIAGFQYMTAGGDKGAVSKAKARMTNTVFGIVILMATYSIAFMIDPRTTRFNSLSIKTIAELEYFPPDGEDDSIDPNISLNGSSEDLEGDNIIAASSGMALDPDALVALQAAANDFYNIYGQPIYIASAKRDLREQARLFYNNCLRTGGSCSVDTCNPTSSSVIKKNGSRFEMTGELAGATNQSTIIASLVSHGAYGNCPHTSAVAVDAWCADGGSNYKHDPACQDALIKTMIKNGFCRLTSEAWHFEYNKKKVSKNCLTSNDSVAYTARAGSFTPQINICKRWDFKNHKCVAQK
jgi:hypothetical protein